MYIVYPDRNVLTTEMSNANDGEGTLIGYVQCRGDCEFCNYPKIVKNPKKTISKV